MCIVPSIAVPILLFYSIRQQELWLRRGLDRFLTGRPQRSVGCAMVFLRPFPLLTSGVERCILSNSLVKFVVRYRSSVGHNQSQDEPSSALTDCSGLISN